MWPKILLVVIGLPVLIQQNFRTGVKCNNVLEIGGQPIIAMSAWLVMQIFTDIGIIITRFKRHTLTSAVVRAFMRGEGVEASQLRKTQRKQLFTSFMRHNFGRLTGAKKRRPRRASAGDPHSEARRRPSQNASQTHADAAAAAAAVQAAARTRKQRRSTLDVRGRSWSGDSNASDDDDDAEPGGKAAPPHALDAVIPIEEASERGERALLALARVENSGTRVPLALLTILSFALGLAGGVYLLLPINHCRTQRLALVLANSYRRAGRTSTLLRRQKRTTPHERAVLGRQKRTTPPQKCERCCAVERGRRRNSERSQKRTTVHTPSKRTPVEENAALAPTPPKRRRRSRDRRRPLPPGTSRFSTSSSCRTSSSARSPSSRWRR